MLPSQRTELGNELEIAVSQPDADAGELRQPNAQVVAVWDDDVAELLEVGAERRQLGHQQRVGELTVRRHGSKLLATPPPRHAVRKLLFRCYDEEPTGGLL